MAGLPVSPLAPAGFPDLPVIAGVRFATVAAGVRYKGRDDVMLAELCPGTVLAGTFTRSATRSAPVRWCEDHIAAAGPVDRVSAILVNSGNSNAFTGGRGEAAMRATVDGVADLLGTTPDRVFPASTGVIGEPLPGERITARLTDLKSALDPAGAEPAARAIMTTDTFPKGAAQQVNLPGGPVQIAGFAKGSGMIEPDMGTMLVYIFTDATIDHGLLQELTSAACDATFNAITVDGDTSTSDTLLVAATGRGAAVTASDKAAFMTGLETVMRDLAQQVVRDGEGATKFVTVTVSGAENDISAKRIGKAIANSPLVKTAIAGEDPNWGRIVMAVGKAGEPADRDRLSIRFGDLLVAENGWVAESYEESDGAAYMKAPELEIGVDLGIGNGQATVWTCDLTHGYISINADYRS